MPRKIRYPIRDSRRKGVALIIVLAILILVTALVVGFLVRTGSERTAAASYRATARTRQLADTVVNLVQGQINQATVATTGSVTATTSGSAWASQPGAIRVFDGQGDQTIYKLYSSGTMVTTNYSSIAGDMPFSTGSSVWMNSPSQWVDLNAPAAFTISGSAATAYPILDPRNPNGNPSLDFTTGSVLTGFQVNPAVIGGTASSTNPIAPMPAQWLYVLQDGTIVPPNLAQSTGTSVILSATNVSASNPIVGRIAFWTDDDTCRLNINTAGDGTFWDSPHFTAPDDWIYAFFSPAEYEYQRYPGHPATTSLLPVFSAVNPTAFPPNPGYSPTGGVITLPLNVSSSGTIPPLYSPINNPYSTLAYNDLFGTYGNGVFTPGLLPQYAYGGSEEATVPQIVTYSSNSPGFASQTPCSLNNERLFSSVGEMLLSPTDSSASPPARSYTSVNGTILLTRQELETAKFFLTAHSRAPELNLHGTPRVSIWPMTVGPAQFVGPASITLSGTQIVPVSIRNTPTDQLLAFASTINENGTASVTGTSILPFYFMRSSNTDATTDFNITRNGTGVYQNQQILDYLDSLMSMPEPGFSYTPSATFYNKYSQYGSLQTGARQILTEIMDYIRTTDTEDGQVAAATAALSGNANGFGYMYGQNSTVGYWGGPGTVVPTLNTMWASTTGTLEGYGTFPRPTCVTLHFVGLGNGMLSGTNGQPIAGGTSNDIPAAQMKAFAGNYDTNNITLSSSNTGQVAAGMVAVQAFVYVQLVCPAAARIDSACPVFWITMSGANGLSSMTLTAGGTTANLGFLSTTGSGSLLYNENLGGAGGIYGNDQFYGPLPFLGETNGGAGGYNGRASGPTAANAPPTLNGNDSVGLNTQYSYPFYSKIITLPYTYVAGGTNFMALGGGSDVVMQLQDASPSADVVETVNLNFVQAAQMGGKLPFPVNPNGLPGTPTAAAAYTSGTLPYTSSISNFLSVGRIIGTSLSSTTANFVGNLTQNDRWNLYGASYAFDPYHDVTASLILSGSWSDPRMQAINNVPNTAFLAHPLWGKQMMAYDLTATPEFIPLPVGNGTTVTGKLQGPANYNTGNGAASYPSINSSSPNGVSFNNGPVVGGLTFGDWDNGVSFTGDGPWINRADEGGASTGGVNTYTGGQINYYYLPYYTAGHGSTIMGTGIFSPNREVPSPGVFGSLPTGVDPTGKNPNPWQTLLFRPGAVINHPGAGAPVTAQTSTSVPPLPPYTTIPDHLILDLFWMPVAEPYAISEPFSTAGKVNLNYQILPYGYITTSGTTAYIRRDTGIRSAMQSLQIGAVPLSAAQTYKSEAQGSWWNDWNGQGFLGDPPASPKNTARLPIDVGQTLQQFDSIFEEGGMFESASQICDTYLVPAGYTLSNFANLPGGSGSWYGSDFAMVGDNVRERPYTDLYSRITTKSNTFTVYFTVQELKNSPTAPPNQWNEATGTVVGEYRGSKDMERYIQQSTSMPNYLTFPAPNPVLTGTASLEPYYRWRIIEDNQFAP